MQFRSLKVIVLFLLLIGANSCRSYKKAVLIPVEKLFYTSCYPIESLFVPSCKLEIFDGTISLSLSGSVYIRPDSVCFFRGRLLMIEAIRGAIFHDSFVVVNYIERVCYKGKMNAKSDDEKYNELIGNLRTELKILAEKIEPKVYEYGFLKN